MTTGPTTLPPFPCPWCGAPHFPHVQGCCPGVTWEAAALGATKWAPVPQAGAWYIERRPDAQLRAVPPRKPLLPEDLEVFGKLEAGKPKVLMLATDRDVAAAVAALSHLEEVKVATSPSLDPGQAIVEPSGRWVIAEGAYALLATVKAPGTTATVKPVAPPLVALDGGKDEA